MIYVQSIPLNQNDVTASYNLNPLVHGASEPSKEDYHGGVLSKVPF